MTMMTPTTHIAKALHNRLTTDVGMLSVLGDPVRAYDNAPEDAVFPYLTYGEMKIEKAGGDDVNITLCKLSLHVWSRYAGRAEVFDILRAVSSALEASPLLLEGGQSALMTLPYMDVVRTSDARTLHGLLRVHVHAPDGGVS